MSPAVKAGRGGGRGRGRPRGASVSAAASSSLATGSISPTSPTSPSLGRGRAGRGGSRGKRGGSIGSMTGRGSSVSTRGSRGGRGGGSRGGGSSRGGGGAGTWGVRGRARGRPAGVGSGGGRGPGRPPGSATSKAAALAKAAAGGGLFSGGQGGPAGVGGGMGSHVLDSSNGSMHSGSSHHSLGSSHSTVRSLGSSAGFGSSVRGRGRGRGGGFGGNAGWSLARVSAREPSPELIPESPPIVSPYAAAIHAKPLDIEPQKCSVCNETMDLLDSKADCASCDYLAHAKCLDLDKALEKVVSSRKDWRCADCKFCHECGTVGNAANILLCDICDNGLHLKCAYPKLSKVPRGEVRCNDCQPAKTLTGKKGAIPVIGAGRNFGRYKFTHDEKQLLTSGANEMELLEVDTSEEKPQQELEFGQHLLKCWYPAPVLACDPEEQSHLPTIHVCEYCLEMHKTPAQIARHRSTCTWRHPPGTEIYRNEDLSFFQVDGRHWKSYCQNLCVLSKCFLKTKTLFYDVQTFLFYVLVQWDKNGGQLVGYFSKEKQPDNNYNLSCLLTFPHKQRQGYGKLLIEFSYLLTRREGKTGSPERPLSDLGLLSYRSYWLDTVAENVVSMAADGDKHVTIKALSDKTGIEMYDIISTLQDTRLIKYTACEHWILTDHPLLEKHKETSAKGARTRIDDKLLVWKPYVPTREDMAIRHQSAGNRARRRHR